MGSLYGGCEIVEAIEELDSELKMGEEVGKDRILNLGGKYSIVDDINKLFEAIHVRSSAGVLGASGRVGRDTLRKSAMKKPIQVQSSLASGIRISESVSLKQALRGLCVSQASEMATMKRLLKPKSAASSGASEAGTIKRLYRAVAVEASESGTPLIEGKGNLIEISLVPETSTSMFSEKIPDSLQMPKAEASNPSAYSFTSACYATITKANLGRGLLPNEIIPLPRGTEKSKSGLVQDRELKDTHSSSRVHNFKRILEVDKIIPAVAEVSSKMTVADKGKKRNLHTSRSPSSSSTDSKASKACKNPPTWGTENSKSELVQDKELKATHSSWRVHNLKRIPDVDKFNPAVAEVSSKTTVADKGPKGNLHTARTLSSSSTGSKASKAFMSPPTIKQVFRNKNFVKERVKQDPSSAPSASSSRDGEIHTGLGPKAGRLIIQSHDHTGNKENNDASLMSRNINLSIDVDSSSLDIGASKPGISLNFSNRTKTVLTKAVERTRSREKGEFSQSSKSSIADCSSSTSISEESILSGSSYSGNRPHMSKDLRWEAIRHVHKQHGTLSLRCFKLLKRLGCGDIGSVYLAELIGSNFLFALKVMDNEFLASNKKKLRAETEREILQILDHPFLPTLYAHFTSDRLSCLVMEYCPGGDLHVLRQKQPNRSFSEQAARFYVAEVLLALEYLHMLGVVYRDLKPENILVREDGHIMLSDFDLSLRCTVSPTLLKSSSPLVEELPTKKTSTPCTESGCIDPFCLRPSWQVSCSFTPRLLSVATKTRKLKSDLPAQVIPLPQLVAEPTSARSNSFVGTHEYLAPEIIKGEGHGNAVDWWTFGIFLYELIYGKTPFKGSGNEDTLSNVVSQSLRFPQSPIVSFHARDLIRGLLIKDPENRLGCVKGAAEIKRHSFFEGLNWALIRCAIPPELPKLCDVGPGTPATTSQNKDDANCLNDSTNTGKNEFELF